MASDRRPPADGTDRVRARSIKELLRSLGTDAARLVRQEIALARAEVTHAIRSIAAAAGRIALGAGLGGVGALTILAALIVLIGQLIGSYWLSALIVGGVLLGGGGFLALTGMRTLREVDPAPRDAIDSVQTTRRWARTEIADVKATLRGRRRGAHVVAAGGTGRLHRPSVAPALPTPGSRPSGETIAVIPRQDRGAEAARGGEGDGREEKKGRQGSSDPPPKSAGTMVFLKHVGKEVQEDEVTGHAAKLAYYAFMAMPPALMALFGLAGLIGSERLASWLEEQAAVALPQAVSESIITPFIEQVVLQEAPGPFSIGLLLALWGGSAMFAGLMETLNHAYDIEETRSFIHKRGLAVLIMIGSVLLFIGAAGALLVGPALVDAVGLGDLGTLLWNLAQWPLAFAFITGAFWCAYYFLPNREQKGTRKVLLKAAAIAALLWVLATAAFRIYIANFSSYSETYGFLGAFIILLLWLYVTGLVVLVGGELASEMERRVA